MHNLPISSLRRGFFLGRLTVPYFSSPLALFASLRVDTANAAESSPSGEGWGWDGEDEGEENGGNDIEMPLASSSKKQAASASASHGKFGRGGDGLGGGFRQPTAIPIAKPPGSSARDSTSMLLSARQEQLGGKGAAAPPRRGGRAENGRGGGGGGGRRGKKKVPDGTGILAVDDDLFAVSFRCLFSCFVLLLSSRLRLVFPLSSLCLRIAFC